MKKAFFAIIAVSFLTCSFFSVNAGAAGYPDSDTAGLWLFDELTYTHTTLTDASEYAKADLCLMEGGRMVSGKFGNALRVGGSNYAVCYAAFAGKVPQEEMRGKDGIPSGLWGPTEGPEAVLNALAAKTWTIEMWINLDAKQSDISIIDMGQAYSPGLSLTLSGGVFELTNHYAGVKAACPAKMPVHRWYHAAFTCDGKSVRLFVNGVEQAPAVVSSVDIQAIPDLQKPEDREHESRGFENMTIEQRKQNRFNLAIGTDRHAAKPMKGAIDELRISRVVRYTEKFRAGTFSRNYAKDAPAPSPANGPALLFDPRPIYAPVNFGARKHVFIDDILLDKKSNVKITMNQPYGKQPLKLDFKIKKSAWRPSVFDVKNEIFMAIPESYSSNEGLTVLATSTDGLSFKRKGKIIPETPMYGAFFKDLNPNVPRNELYKVNSFVANRGMYFYTSPDGLKWRRNETIQLPLVSGGGGECFWDDQRGRYISFIKRDSSFKTKKYPGIGPHGHKAIMFESNELLRPWSFKALEKPWYEGWPFPSVTGEGVTVFTAQKYGWVYRTRAIKYPWAPDVYLAFIWRYPGDDGARHVELAVSRNGRDWKLFGTNWYIPTGAKDEEITMYGLLRLGNEIWQYVNEGGAHGGSAPRYWSRYKQRLDGFVSLDAGSETGTATTLPLRFQGNHLTLNIKATGSARVAITDENGKAFPGFGFDDCDRIKGDFVEKTVTWKGNDNVKSLAGKTVRLKFQMQNTKLYAFEFTTPVLMIGDSITGGYMSAVKRILKGKAQIRVADYRYPNILYCESSQRGRQQLDNWLGNTPWDVIHFNFGLHDIKYVDDLGEKTKVSKGRQNIPVEQYEKNLEEFVVGLKKTGAKLVFATTTPVPEGSSGRVKGDAAMYNISAVRIMEKHGIQVNDLYALAIARQEEIQRPGNVHFKKPEGYEVLARQVASYIGDALK